MTINPPDPIYSSAGSDLTLSCSAQSSPPAHYQWFFNGAPLNKLGSQLNMAHIQHNQTGNYTCWAFNNITLRYGDVTRSITVIAPISNINVKPTPAQPIENNTFSLTCNVTGTADSRLWWKDDQPLSTTERITLSGDNSTVSFNPVLQSDNGTYQCTASDPVSQLNSTGYRLDVNYGPEQVSITGPDASRIGSTAVFTCSALSQPGCEYTWFINGKLVAKGSPYKIHPVNSSNDGSYTCTAWNSLTERNSSAVKMHHVLGMFLLLMEGMLYLFDPPP
ncbi:carcinoembryonic antigen-related cell adhesion molecule 5-like [Acipenser oxyrinchus oxyrinchus]|uniref:Carcinoembryonic antigen-related cell adhesion molecule 5-like n=1 Tax=Acipenser oxyrinchus oxyrinchus TaxID=40147 RepID=A0AAD8CLH8_ACIOX|nr:carcinoembryonic antigen-related cell adhesion molecule 5-like [Acipenser oxyrinchus oxyrinchus]